jgi:hypothetical protein
MDAPVVVNPDVDSKKASEKVQDSIPKKKGNAPQTLTAIQPRDTIAIPSRVRMDSMAFFLKRKYMQNPQTVVMAIDNRMGITLSSP